MTERDPNAQAPQAPPTDSGWHPTTPEPRPELTDNHTHSMTDGAVAVPVARAGGGATRWGIALVVAALVIGLAAAAIFFAAGSSTPSTLVGWAPKDALVWSEARLDLPGDQQANLGEFLSKFPGFADQSTLESKLDEALDRIVKSATKDSQDYSTKIKPWFGGEIAMAVPQLPDPATLSGSSTPQMSALALVSVSDATKARAWFDDLVKDQPHSTSTYNGVDLVTVGEAGGDHRGGVMGIADGKVMLLGDDASVKAAIDSKGQGGLADVDQFKAAADAMSGDAVATYYIDMKRYLDWSMRAAGEADTTGMAAYLSAALGDRTPAWVAGRARIEGDALRVEQVQPHVDAGPKRENRTSNVVDNLPASTIVALDSHDLGATIRDTVDLFRGAPGTADAFKQVDQAVALVGGWDALLGWMGDADVVVTRNGTAVGGGLVAATTDKAASDRLITTLKGFLALAGGSTGLTMSEEAYNGTTITVLSLPAGATGELPVGAPQIGIAATDQVVVVGASLDFVKSVLDAKPGSSLADEARYKALADRVGSKNYSSVWLDATGIRELAEQLGGQMSPSDKADYEKEIKPYLVPFDAIAGAAVVDGSYDRMTFVLTVK